LAAKALLQANGFTVKATAKAPSLELPAGTIVPILSNNRTLLRKAVRKS
jgi:hypothetical protein